MEATKTLEKNPEYISWLHELTVAGYDKGVMIEAEYSDFIAFIYQQNLSIEDSLDMFNDIKKWLSLNEVKINPALQLVTDELSRHLDLGYDDAHDDEHTAGELSIGAALYAIDETNAAAVAYGIGWPTAVGRDKRDGLDRKRKLVIAASLIIAEINRLLRLDAIKPSEES